MLNSDKNRNKENLERENYILYYSIKPQYAGCAILIQKSTELHSSQTTTTIA